LASLAAKRLSGKAVLGFFVDQQNDKGEPLWFVGRLRQQFAIAVVIKSCVWLTHGPASALTPSADDCSATGVGAQGTGAIELRCVQGGG
jgi:hypothetical protein